MAKVKPQVIDDQEHERVYERVAAVDVAKDSGMVCTRTPHPSRPGARRPAQHRVDGTGPDERDPEAGRAAEGGRDRDGDARVHAGYPG